MRLDASFVRYLSHDDYRVLTSVEIGSKNHEIVPTTLIASISKMKSGGVHKILGELCKRTLVARESNSSYDGYRLTYGGYDYLALHTFSARSTLVSVGHQLGTGKESDIYHVTDHENNALILKIQRLGRTSFRTVRTNRDYAGKGRKVKGASWMYLSRLAAKREWAFLTALYERKFPVPRPRDQNRHCIVMDLIKGVSLGQVHKEDLGDTDNVELAVSKLYETLMNLIIRLAEHGLIHGDFNEFNLLVEHETNRLVMIDFPQMVSTSHQNAKYYFDRDVKCILDFFMKRFGFVPDNIPDFDSDVKNKYNLDVELSASGFDKVIPGEGIDEQSQSDSISDSGNEQVYTDS